MSHESTAMASEADFLNRLGEDISCLMVGGAVHKSDLLVFNHESDKVIANVDVLEASDHLGRKLATQL